MLLVVIIRTFRESLYFPVDDYQTHHRLREATGRKRAEQLNERVLLWSLGQTALIVLIGIAQVGRWSFLWSRYCGDHFLLDYSILL